MVVVVLLVRHRWIGKLLWAPSSNLPVSVSLLCSCSAETFCHFQLQVLSSSLPLPFLLQQAETQLRFNSLCLLPASSLAKYPYPIQVLRRHRRSTTQSARLNLKIFPEILSRTIPSNMPLSDGKQPHLNLVYQS